MPLLAAMPGRFWLCHRDRACAETALRAAAILVRHFSHWHGKIHPPGPCVTVVPSELSPLTLSKGAGEFLNLRSLFLLELLV